MTKNFTYKILGCQIWDFDNDNIDIHIFLENGNVYSTTLFTILNIIKLMNKNKKSGEYCHGTYIWALNMIIVDNLKPETIERAIAGLVENGELDAACYRIH